MTMVKEALAISDECAKRGETLTARAVVEAARDAKQYPKLHDHIWQADDETLLDEARLTRAHQVIMRIRVEVIDGGKVRGMIHIQGTPGYQSTAHVVSNFDLAAAKAREYLHRLRSDQQRFDVFFQMMSPKFATRVRREVQRLAAIVEAEAKKSERQSSVDAAE